jgi:hypothetical protein
VRGRVWQLRAYVFFLNGFVFDLTSILSYFKALPGLSARGREGDAAYRLLVATGLPPGLVARDRGVDAASQLATDPGTRLGRSKYVVKNFLLKPKALALMRIRVRIRGCGSVKRRSAGLA